MKYRVLGKQYIVRRAAPGQECCSLCCFGAAGTCKASDLFDTGLLPQCDEDGVGYPAYYQEV